MPGHVDQPTRVARIDRRNGLHHVLEQTFGHRVWTVFVADNADRSHLIRCNESIRYKVVHRVGTAASASGVSGVRNRKPTQDGIGHHHE